MLLFGLTNAAATFMTLMNDADCLDKFVFECIDDILLYRRPTADHVGHLRAVPELLRTHKLSGKVSKCVIAAPGVEYLGHIIGHSRFSVDP